MKAIWLMMILLVATLSLQAMLTVKQDGTGDFTGIQAALEAADDGDTILVWPGRYYENLDVGTTNNLTIASLELTTGDVAYRDSTIIDGNQSGTCIYIPQEGSFTTIRGFTMTNGSGFLSNSGLRTTGGGVCAGSDLDLTIINCRIHHNQAHRGGGIAIWLGSTLHIAGVSIHDNTAEWQGGGIFIYSFGDAANYVDYSETNRCSIYNNFSAEGSDICRETTGFTVPVIVDTFTVVNPSRYYCNADRPMNPFVFDIQHAWMEEINHDLFVAPWGDDDNDGLSESTPLRSVHLAIQRIATDSLAPKTVHLAAGDYYFEGNDIAIHGKPWVTVQGAGQDETILHGANIKYGMFHKYRMDHFTVRDLTLRNWHQGIRSCNCYDLLIENVTVCDAEYEYAMSIEMGSNVRTTFRNCTLRDYYSAKIMPGFHASTIEDLVIDGMLITGMENSAESSDGNAFDVGIDGNATINNLRIVGNHGHSYSPDWPDFMYDVFQIHEGYFSMDTLRISNCLFADNTQDASGAAMGYIGAPPPAQAFITNCTFANNSGGAYMFAIYGNVTFDNNIFWNEDLGHEIEIPFVGTYNANTTFRNNCIRGGEDGIDNQYSGNIVNWLEGNVDVEPGFSNMPGMEYVLSPDSPLLDIGVADTTGLFLPPYDLGCNERVWDGDGDGTARIDMGCYEFQAMPPPSALEASVDVSDITFTWLPPTSPLRSQTGYRLFRDSTAVTDIEGAMTTDFTLVNAESGQHSYWLTATYGVLDSAPTNAVDVYIDPAVYAAPQNLEANVEGFDVELGWQAPEQSRAHRTRELTGYMVYRDSLAVALVGASVLEHMDEDVALGAHSYRVTAVYGPIESQPSNTVDVEVVCASEGTPAPVFTLACRPNPFNPETTIHYSIPSAGSVDMRIFNVRGQCVARLVGERREAGEHSVTWRPGTLASGVYFVRLKAGGESKSSKLLLLK